VVIVIANSGVRTFKNILSLKQEMDSLTISFGKKAHNASKLIELLCQKPIIAIGYIIEFLEMSMPTINSLVKEFENRDILMEITGFQINKLFTFSKFSLEAFEILERLNKKI